MLDDRTNTPDPYLVPLAGWTYDDNIAGWTALLGQRVGGLYESNPAERCLSARMATARSAHTAPSAIPPRS